MFKNPNCRLAKIIGLFLFGAAAWCQPADAQGPQYYSERKKTMDSEKWSFSNYLAGKAQMKNQDVLYRFYQGGSEKNRPRVEPHFYGLGLTGSSTGDPESSSFKGVGYGGSVYFNNFLSSMLRTPTPNLVFGVFGERREEQQETPTKLQLLWGGSVRLLAMNHQDTGIFLNYRVLRRDVAGKPWREHAWEAAGKLYISPQMSLEGGYIFGKNEWPATPSDRGSHSGYWGGGSLEIMMFRLSARFEKDRFSLAEKENGVKSTSEIRRILMLGLVI